MPTIIPGNYTISHGSWPVSAPSKPGQELTIVLTNPADIKGDVVSVHSPMTQAAAAHDQAVELRRGPTARGAQSHCEGLLHYD